MISSTFLNNLYRGLANIAEKITGNHIDVKKIEFTSDFKDADKVLNENNQRILKAFEDPKISIVGSLEPGKIYVLKVDTLSSVWVDLVEEIVRICKEYNIKIVLIGEGMEFVSVPEGYELVKKEGS